MASEKELEPLARWLVVTCWYPAGMSIRIGGTLLSKQGNMPAGPDRPLFGGLSPAPAACSGTVSSCQTVSEPEGCRGIWTFCTGSDLSASGHVALLLLARKTKCKLIPCSSWAMEAPWGCSPLQLNPLPAAEACGKQGWCWSCSGQLCLH